MTPPLYQPPPLSDEMEKRIREKLRNEEIDLHGIFARLSEKDQWLCRARIAALEWVLREAESVKMATASSFEELCHSCGHLHASEAECGMPMGAAGKCLCDRRVTA